MYNKYNNGNRWLLTTSLFAPGSPASWDAASDKFSRLPASMAADLCGSCETEKLKFL